MFRLTFHTVLSSTPCSVEMNIWIVFFVIGLEMILSVDRALNIKCFCCCCCCCCCFNICIVPLGFLLLGNSGRFPRGKAAATESRYPTYSACWVILVFPSIHRALTWDYRIFYVRVGSVCMRMHTGPGFRVSSEGLCGVMESAQKLTPGKLAREALHETAMHHWLSLGAPDSLRCHHQPIPQCIRAGTHCAQKTSRARSRFL